MAKSKQKEKTTLSREIEVRKEIEVLDVTVDSSFIKLALLLSEAYHNHYYTSWGYSDFGTYIDSELHIHYRKAMHLIKIIDTIKALNVPIEKVEHIGWTKLRELMSVITAENADDLLNKAAGMSQRDITEHVKLIKEKDLQNASIPITRTLKIVMEEDTGEIVEEALSIAKKLMNTDSNALALSMICQDWLSNQDQIPVKTSIKSLIKYIEKIYGVRVTIDDSTEKINSEIEIPDKLSEDEADISEKQATKRRSKRKIVNVDENQKKTKKKDNTPLIKVFTDSENNDTEPELSIDDLIGL